jgi:peptidoglycan-associated lipoprotein
MLKRISFYAFFVSFAAMFMTAGCAKQDVVKKDEGIVPPSIVKQTEPPKSNITSSGLTAATREPQISSAPVDVQSSQKVSSMEWLQSSLDIIYFNFDSAVLSESARSVLTKNASALMNVPTAKIRIEGNCDERGSAEYNLALGEHRAAVAKQYLVTLGIKPERLSTISYGEEKPTVQGNDEAAWVKNRRDEFVVVTP